MEIEGYLRLVRQRWQVVVGAVVVAMFVSMVASSLMPKKYEATAQLFLSTNFSVSDNSQLNEGSNFVQQRVKSYAEAVTSPLILDSVIDDLALNVDVAALARSIEATVPLDTVIIEISVADGDSAQAVAIADAVSKSFADVVPTLESVDPGASPVRVTLLNEASATTTQVSPRPVLNLALGALIGASLGSAVALLLGLRQASRARPPSHREQYE